MGVFSLLYGLMIFFIAVAASMAVTVPLLGTLVRLRANYNPKALQLDPEGDVTPHTGPVVTSYFGMMMRTRRLEGISGLYKGLMPTLISTLIISSFAVVALHGSVINPRGHARFDAPSDSILGMLAFSFFFMFVSLPALVVTNRTITTPHKLPYFKPRYALSLLLSPTERLRPWTLYLTPGLLASQCLHVLYVLLVLRTTRRFLLPSLSTYPTMADGQTGIPEDFTVLRLGIYGIIAIASTFVLCPLEVISIRLSIQRNHANAQGFGSVEQEEEADAATAQAEYAAPEEDVIGLRNEKDPYTGLVDCVKSIAQEEGVGALYRGWWLTMLSGIIGAFS